MADKRSYLAWLQTATHKDVVMALVEDGSLLLAIQQELKAAAPLPASAALQADLLKCQQERDALARENLQAFATIDRLEQERQPNGPEPPLEKPTVRDSQPAVLQRESIDPPSIK